jgi:hypothetical protein
MFNLASSPFPSSLRDWVQRCLKEASSTNKDKVHAELKKVRAPPPNHVLAGRTRGREES